VETTGVKKADSQKMVTALLILQFVFQVLMKIFNVMVKL